MVLTIGIPVYNGKDKLRKCLNSIYQNLRGDFKVVVCDDGSTDGTAKMVRQRFQKVVFLRNSTNRGVSFAANRILEQIDGDYLLRLDADTQVLPGSVEALVEFMQAHPRCGAVAASLVDEKGNLQKNVETHLQRPIFWLGEYLLWLKKIWMRFFEQRSNNAHQVAAMGSAAILVRKAAIGQVGGLDEKMRFFLEDSDWVMRVRKAGWELWYCPKAQIIHTGGQSAGPSDLYIHCRDQSLKSLYYFTNKHFPGRLNQVLLRASILTGSLISLVLALLVWLPSRFGQRAKIVVDRGLRSFSNVWRWHFVKV